MKLKKLNMAIKMKNKNVNQINDNFDIVVKVLIIHSLALLFEAIAIIFIIFK